MGYMRHHAIVVTSWNKEALKEAHLRAAVLFDWKVSPIIHNQFGDDSFFIPPDGSKEGWEDSNKGDQRRTEFIAYLRSVKYDDSSSCLSWVEVEYGGDGGRARAVASYP